MAYDTQDLETIYDEFLTKGLEKLVALQKETGMEDEYLAEASASIISSAMQNTVGAMNMLKNNQLIDKKIATEITNEKVLGQKYVGRRQ